MTRPTQFTFASPSSGASSKVETHVSSETLFLILPTPVQNSDSRSEARRTRIAKRAFLHRGIASRAFERRFQLADHVEVRGADVKDGLLSVDLEREVPERLKPRTIEIGAAAAKGNKTIDALVAA